MKGGDVYEGIEKSLQKPTVENPAAKAADGFGKDYKQFSTKVENY